MVSFRDDAENRKIVTFYMIYTTLHFPIVLLSLYYSGGFYKVGKYSSQLVLMIIAFAEMMKYTVSVVYLKKYYNLSRRHENVTLLSFFRSLFNKSKLREGFKTISTVFVSIIVYFTISIIFGAELFGKTEETLMFSSLLAVLTIFPICINLGSQSVISILTGFRPTNKLEYLLFQNVYLTCFGAWLGAFVIPLDWDRPWQEWPIPCSIGAMFGFQLSHVLMVFHSTYAPVKMESKR